MLVASLDLVGLHRDRVDAIDHVHKVICLFLVGHDVKVTRHLIAVQVPTYCNELSLHGRVLILDQIGCIGLPLLAKLLLNFVPLGSCQILACGCCLCCLCLASLRLISSRSCGLHCGSCSSRLFCHHSLRRLICITKEIIILRLVHEVRLVAFDHRHVVDGGLGKLRAWLLDRRDDALVEEGLCLVVLSNSTPHFIVVAQTSEQVTRGSCHLIDRLSLRWSSRLLWSWLLYLLSLRLLVLRVSLEQQRLCELIFEARCDTYSVVHGLRRIEIEAFLHTYDYPTVAAIVVK